MVREGAIHIAIQRHHIATQFFQQTRRNHTRYTATAIHHHFVTACQHHIRHNMINIRIDNFLFAVLAFIFTFTKIAGLYSLTNVLNFFTRQRMAIDHHFETVIRRWIVAGSDHNAATGFWQSLRSKIHQRCGHSADVHHGTTCHQ